ncbi:hypothetical protein SY2F82_77170 [Streptomyces sp. Y2F8-2]|nr:Tn3 family transposase [Streptomyces sp. Y2F8-2]GHK05920.1 hypothetical protein SY2F82_77170 [Streptomyces sp. Y2F8-2]
MAGARARSRPRSFTDATATVLHAYTAPAHPFAPDTPWTTRYLDAAVGRLRALPPEEREHDVRDEDVARLSPLKHANLNVLGRYSIRASVPADCGLRPLRDPDADEHAGD